MVFGVMRLGYDEVREAMDMMMRMMETETEHICKSMGHASCIEGIAIPQIIIEKEAPSCYLYICLWLLTRNDWRFLSKNRMNDKRFGITSWQFSIEHSQIVLFISCMCTCPCLFLFMV